MIEEISHFSSVLSSHQVCKLTPKLSHYVYSVHDQGISSKLGHVTSKRYFLTISYETYLKHVAFFITPLVVSSASTEKKHTHQLLRPRKCLSKRHRMEVMSEGGSSWIEDEEEHPVSFFVWQQQLDPEEPGLDDITTEGQSILIWNMLKLLCDQLPLILTLSYSWKFH